MICCFLSWKINREPDFQGRINLSRQSADNMNKLSTNQWLAIKVNAQCWLDHVHDNRWKTKAMISGCLQLDYITISEPIARRIDALDTQLRSANASRCLPLCWPSFRFWLMNNRDWRETFEKDFHSVFDSFWWYWTAKSVSDSCWRARRGGEAGETKHERGHSLSTCIFAEPLSWHAWRIFVFKLRIILSLH